MSRHAIARVRHELKRRTLTIAHIEQLTPGMRRIHFTSPDLADFPSVGFDDHVKAVSFPRTRGCGSEVG